MATVNVTGFEELIASTQGNAQYKKICCALLADM